MKKYTPSSHRSLARCAAIWAERALPLFESEFPADDRPRTAIKALRTWVRTGVFKMADIRGASLSAHAAARAAEPGSAACFAARAAGQAVATAHVPQHAFGSSYYALKAMIAASGPSRAESAAHRELERQASYLPASLKREFLKTVVLERKKNGILVRVIKGPGF